MEFQLRNLWGEHSFLVNSLKRSGGEEYILKYRLKGLWVWSHKTMGNSFRMLQVVLAPCLMSLQWSVFIFTPLSGQSWVVSADKYFTLIIRSHHHFISHAQSDNVSIWSQEYGMDISGLSHGRPMQRWGCVTNRVICCQDVFSAQIRDTGFRSEYICVTRCWHRHSLGDLTSVPPINERICLKRTIETNLSDTSVDDGKCREKDKT